jgi:hypothetical protein
VAEEAIALVDEFPQDADAGFQIRLGGNASIDTDGPETAARERLLYLTPARSSGIRYPPEPRSTHEPKLRSLIMSMAKGISP